MPRRLDKTLADYMVIGLSPALIIALVNSLMLFLLEVCLPGGDKARIVWITFLYVLATVLIARISIEEGKERAALFAVPLMGVMTLAMMRGGGLSLSVIFVLAFIWWVCDRLTWDCTLIDEREDSSGQGLLEIIGLDPDAKAPADAGASAPASTEPKSKQDKSLAERIDRWWDRRHRRRGAPGLWVIYFSLAALPMFGLGQLLVPAADTDRRRYVFWLLVAYVASGLGLLLTTSFLGLRRYLRQRKLEMPVSIASVWLSVGGIMAAALLLAAMLIPRPSAEYPISSLGLSGLPRLNANRFAIMRDSPGQGPGQAGHQNKPQGSPADSSPQPPPQAGPGQHPQAQSAGGGQPGGSQQGSQQAGGERSGGQQQPDGQQSSGTQQPGAPSTNGQQSNTGPQPPQSSTAAQTANSPNQSSGQPQQPPPANSTSASQPSQPAASESPSGQPDAAAIPPSQQQALPTQPQSPPSQSQSRDPQPGQAQPAQQQPPSNPPRATQSQATESTPAAQPRQPSAAAQPHPSRTAQSQPAQTQTAQSPPAQSQTTARPRFQLPNLGGMAALLFRWALNIGLVVLAVYLCIKYRTQLAEYWRQFLAAWHAFWARLFGGKPQAAATEETTPAPPVHPFAAYANPFATGAAQRASANELVCYTFNALQAWAVEHGLGRSPDATPLEFAAQLGASEPRLSDDARELAQFFSRVAYASERLPSDQVRPPLSRLWSQLR